jgi:hypothetical protein
LQREVCYCHTTAYINHITSLFWQMQDSCPFTLCKLEIQPFWDWQCVKDMKALCSNKTPGMTHPKTQHHTSVDLNPQQCWFENLNLSSLLISLWRTE